MRETGLFDLQPASIDLAETLIQTPLFDDEIQAHALRAHPETFPQPVLSERSMLVRAALRMAAPHRHASPGETHSDGSWWPTPRAIQEITRTHASSLRLMGRQLTMLKNLEAYVERRTPLPHMEEIKASQADVVASIVKFLQTHQPNDNGQPEETAYQLVRKEGVVYSSNDVHQDYVMAVVLREAGIGRPASDKYPAPLKAMIVTPTADETYRLAFRRQGNSTFQRVAPDVQLITTKRYRSLINDQGGRVVVTHPEFLESALLSGKMTNNQFDLIMTDNFSGEEADDLHELIHAQEVGPVILDFAIGHRHTAGTGAGSQGK